MRKSLFALTLLLIPVFLTACARGPKSKADDYAERMPEEIGSFKLDEDRTVKLSAEAIGNTGSIALMYESGDVGEVYVVIETYGTESAAEVALEKRMRDLRLYGADFSSDRVAKYKVFPRVDVTEMPNGRVAFFSYKAAVLEVQYIKAAPEATISEEDWDAILTAVREVGETQR
jgi:hypothetical protein